jgi:hypothetical protein
MGLWKPVNQKNEEAIQSFLYPKKVMAEEVLHANPGAKILPQQPLPDVLPPMCAMVGVLHKTCKGLAFYYTHVPARGEMMTASRARDIRGKPIEPGAKMECGNCQLVIEGANFLQVRKADYEAANGK